MTGPDPATFLSGETGHVAGIRRTALARLADAALDLRLRAGGAARRLDGAAASAPRRTILVMCVHRGTGAPAGLASTRHDVRLELGEAGERGKFQNLNLLLERAGGPADWTLVVDDDVVLPEAFLDRMVGVCEEHGFALAQPAQTRASHAAWRVTRRRPGLARESAFVEIGPVTAFRRDSAEEFMPFPDLRYGWGLDLHWAAVARERGMRLGIVDALPVRHESGPVAATYSAAAAIEEARAFLDGRPYLRAGDVA
ncbi:MAG TPA: glycosyltransferase [Thermoleophilaceae bacterium]|nr:glycosyltransferase [Thermoleophilaceae bacterium]